MLNPFSQKRDLARKFVPKSKTPDGSDKAQSLIEAPVVNTAQIQSPEIPLSPKIVETSILANERVPELQVPISVSIPVPVPVPVQIRVNVMQPPVAIPSTQIATIVGTVDMPTAVTKKVRASCAVRVSKQSTSPADTFQPARVGVGLPSKSVLPAELYGEDCPYELHTVYLKKNSEVSPWPVHACTCITSPMPDCRVWV